ncbi:MAG: HIT domain-containing protein [Halothiobacillaceae bacterium]
MPLDFTLHPRLAADTVEVTVLTLCQVRLMHDAHYPWLILIPQRSGLRELHELSEDDQFQLMRESSHVARCMTQLFHPEKLNVAALGNLVPQLHIHHIARYSDDPAWPHPVWGHTKAKPYAPQALAARVTALREALAAAS